MKPESEDLTFEEEHDLMGLWLSRLMFGWIVGMDERRSWEEYRQAVLQARR